MTFCKLRQYCHTHPHTRFVLKTKQQDDCTAVNLSHSCFL